MMPGVRTFISLPAGIAKMPVGKFLLYSFLGSVPWNAGLAYLGYGAGKAAGEDPWGKLQEQFGRYNEIFYIVLARGRGGPHRLGSAALAPAPRPTAAGPTGGPEALSRGPCSGTSESWAPSG